MPRKHKDIAELHGITVDVVKNMSRDGVKVHDDEAMREALAKKRHRISDDAKISDDEASEIDLTTLAGLKDLLLQTQDIATAKIIKEKADAFKKILAAEKEEGLVIALREVHERETKIGVAVKAAFDKMENDLPGACAGLDEVGIIEVYRKLKREILVDLADLQSDFWRGRRTQEDE